MTTTIQPAFDGAERLPLPPRDTWTAAQAEAAKELVPKLDGACTKDG